jgi:hypothetical protein
MPREVTATLRFSTAAVVMKRARRFGPGCCRRACDDRWPIGRLTLPRCVQFIQCVSDCICPQIFDRAWGDVLCTCKPFTLFRNSDHADSELPVDRGGTHRRDRSNRARRIRHSGRPGRSVRCEIPRLGRRAYRPRSDCRGSRSTSSGWPAILRTSPENHVRTRLFAGGKRIRTVGPSL